MATRSELEALERKAKSISNIIRFPIDYNWKRVENEEEYLQAVEDHFASEKLKASEDLETEDETPAEEATAPRRGRPRKETPVVA